MRTNRERSLPHRLTDYRLPFLRGSSANITEVNFVVFSCYAGSGINVFMDALDSPPLLGERANMQHLCAATFLKRFQS